MRHLTWLAPLAVIAASAALLARGPRGGGSSSHPVLGRLAGRLLDAPPDALAAAELVALPSEPPGESYTTRLAGDGSFALEVRPGRYHLQVRAHAPRRELDWVAAPLFGLPVAAGESVDDLDLVARGGVVVQGRVTVGETGLPLAGAFVVAQIAYEPAAMTWFCAAGDDGRYRLHLPAGYDYRLAAHPAWLAEAVAARSPDRSRVIRPAIHTAVAVLDLTGRSAALARQDFDVTCGRHLVARLQGADGPVAGLAVAGRQAYDPVSRRAVTDADGRFALIGLMQQPVRLRVGDRETVLELPRWHGAEVELRLDAGLRIAE